MTTSRGTMKFSSRVRQARITSRSSSRALVEHDEGPHGLAEQLVGHADHGRLAHPWRSWIAFSTSTELTFSPRVLMMSSLRSTK